MSVHHNPTSTAVVKSISVDFGRRPVVNGALVRNSTESAHTLVADAAAVISPRTGGVVGVATDLPGPSSPCSGGRMGGGPWSKTHRTISLDYRGTGETRAAETDWSTFLYADDAGHVLEACGVTGAHLHGAPMGGRVTQVLAAQASVRAHRLVLACSSPEA